MSLKLKISLVVLLLIAGFLVVRLGLYFKKSVEVASNQNGAEVLGAKYDDPLEADTDGDGLSDRDEIIYGTDPFDPDTDGDGYLDGEEIATGYNPLDPAQENQPHTDSTILSQNTANLTDRLLSLGLASMIDDSGSLDPEQVGSQRYADIMESISNEASLVLGAIPLGDSDIKITDDNSETSIRKYLNSATKIVEEGIFSSGIGISAQNQPNIAGVQVDEEDYYETKYRTLKTLEVPSSWKEIHKQALLNLIKLSTSSKALNGKNIEDDPIKAGFALTQLQQSFLALHDVLNGALSLARSQKIPLNDSLLETLQSVK